MEELFKSYATEDDFNAHVSELKQGLISELGYDNIEALQAALAENPNTELQASFDELKIKYDDLTAQGENAITELKRSLSEKTGINLFKDDAIEEFKVKAKQTADTLALIKNENEALQAEKNVVDVENHLLKIGIQVKRIERAKSLVLAEVAAGKSVNEAVSELLGEFPEWISGAGSIGANLSPDNSTLTERERYFKENGYTK